MAVQKGGMHARLRVLSAAVRTQGRPQSSSWSAAMQATTPPQQSRTSLSWLLHAKEPVLELVSGPPGLVALGCRDSLLLITHAQTKQGAIVEKLPGGRGPFSTICFLGSTLVASGLSGVISAWDTATRAHLASKRLFPAKETGSGDSIKDWVLLRNSLSDSHLAAACCETRYAQLCQHPPSSVLEYYK